MDDDEIDDYVDPIVEAKKLKKKKKDERFVIFDYLTFGSFFSALGTSYCAIFSWDLMPIHYQLFLFLLWFYVWVVMWIDKNLVRACFNLTKFIKCVFRQILNFILFIREVKVQLAVGKGVWEFVLEKLKKVSNQWKEKLKKVSNQWKQAIYFRFIETFKLCKKQRRKRKVRMMKKQNSLTLKQTFKNRVQSKKELELFIEELLLTSSKK